MNATTLKALLPALALAALLSGCDEKKAAAPAEAPAPVAAKPVEAPKPAKTEIKLPAGLAYSTAAADIEKGKEAFTLKGCPACHKVGGGKLVGPDLKGVTARRDIEWLAKMILKPEVMIKEDEVAKKMFMEHMLPMPNQNVDAEKDLPLILTYLKSVEQ